jgi:hypothetical protein
MPSLLHSKYPIPRNPCGDERHSEPEIIQAQVASKDIIHCRDSYFMPFHLAAKDGFREVHMTRRSQKLKVIY